MKLFYGTLLRFCNATIVGVLRLAWHALFVFELILFYFYSFVIVFVLLVYVVLSCRALCSFTWRAAACLLLLLLLLLLRLNFILPTLLLLILLSLLLSFMLCNGIDALKNYFETILPLLTTLFVLCKWCLSFLGGMTDSITEHVLGVVVLAKDVFVLSNFLWFSLWLMLSPWRCLLWDRLTDCVRAWCTRPLSDCNALCKAVWLLSFVPFYNDTCSMYASILFSLSLLTFLLSMLSSFVGWVDIWRVWRRGRNRRPAATFLRTNLPFYICLQKNELDGQ